MVKIINEIPTYDESETPCVRVHSHWNRADMVVIEIADKKVTVAASDINAAVKNATNTARHG